ncbi:MAG: ABC transporter permease, partial [Chloroflexi bacterium]|nr:ABC transporter permease [Chloroflexota bacterium]
MAGRLAFWGALAYRVGVVVALFMLWEIVQSIPVGDPDLFPRPSKVVGETWAMAASGTLVEHGVQSITRILAGWGLATLLGIPIGLAMGSWRAIEESVGTVVHFLRPISPVAWIPLAILLFGFGFGGPMFIVFLAAFYPTVLAATAAVREVETVQMDAVRTLGASDFAVYREVVLPGAMPGILMGLRIALGNAWGAVVAAEIFGAKAGLGYLITQSVVFFELSDVMVGMVLIGVAGFVLDG